MDRPSWVDQREYQKQAIDSWLTNDARGILSMATGTGKTITALLAASRVAKTLDDELAVIIAVPYQHLVEQWAEDVRDFGINPVLAYESRTQWQNRLEREILELNIGVRDSLAVITTHKTFASELFQTEVSRFRSSKKMFIADEVHHLGAPHTKDGLPESVMLRLGLSATPERWYDDEGTEELMSYFESGIVFEYSLQKAIQQGNLCEYYYVPHIIEMTPDEIDKYMALSRKIARLANRMGSDLADADLKANSSLKFALFNRARLVGTAENKLRRLIDLLRDEPGNVSHTLVYCGDGSVSRNENNPEQRHVDVVTKTIRNELGLKIRKFTAEVSQERRQILLEQFKNGEIDVLAAIRCLDEGVDIPATKNAYVLASSSNPRQFIQRRGRILRTHPSKQYAVIHDFIMKPPRPISNTSGTGEEFRAEQSLVRKELQRVNHFATAARNHPDADVRGIPTGSNKLQQLKRRFDLLEV